MNLRKTDSNSSAGSAASAAPANGETASGPGTPMTGEKIKLGKQTMYSISIFKYLFGPLHF